MSLWRMLDRLENRRCQVARRTRLSCARGSVISGRRAGLTSQLPFTPNEVAELRSLGLPTGIKILGFQSPQNLKFDENIRHSFFLYPDETVI